MSTKKQDITRRRLEVQGFMDLDDDTLTSTAPWLRMATGLCMLFALVSTVLTNPWISWLGMLTAFAGMISPRHPFDLIYNYGIRHITDTGILPERGVPGRFSCAVATLWYAILGIVFYVDANMLGYGLGIAFLLVSGLVILTNICIPSIIYHLITTRSTKNVCIRCSKS